MPRAPIVLLLLLSLTACASAPEAPRPLGRLSLRVPVEIPAGAATLRLQYGHVTPFNAVQEQDPFCVFELDTVSDQPQAVAPAVFDIAGIVRREETFAGMPRLPFRAFRVGSGLGSDDGPSHIYFKTTFHLAPNPQRVRNLTCMSNQYMPGIAIMRHLSLEEMRGALGGFFSLDLYGGR